ncbi:hypothetical protein JTB14_027314 [Gonioctena quinquepunctata]|nr:hypothetical protein JTB14_027314 [Gonioctena quinquepunctata]
MPSKCRKYDESLIEKALREMETNGSSYRKVAENSCVSEADIRKWFAERQEYLRLDLTSVLLITFCVTYATRRILTEDEPYEYDTEQTAKNIEGVAQEVHGIGTRKKKVMEINAEESDRENEKNYVDEDTDIFLNMYQEETCSYNSKGNLTLS